MQDVILEGNRIIVRSYGGAEYAGAPKSWPAVVLEGKENWVTSSVETIYSGPYHGAKLVAETGCPSAGHLAMVIEETLEITREKKDPPPIGSIHEHLDKALDSFEIDGISSLAYNLSREISPGIFSEPATKVIQEICKAFFAIVTLNPIYQEATKKFAGNKLDLLHKNTSIIACAKIGKEEVK
jgi:hypothetical protein